MQSVFASVLIALLARGASAQDTPAPESLTLDLAEARILRHGAEVHCAQFSPDSALLATGGEDGRLRFWNTRAGFVPPSSDGLPAILDFGIEGALSALAFSPDGTRIAFGGGRTGNAGQAPFEIRIENVQAGRAGIPIRLRGHVAPVLSLAFSPRGDLLASGSADGSIRLWTLAQPGEPKVISQHQKAVTTVLVSPDGSSVFSSSADGSIREWDVTTGEVRVQFETGGKPVSTIALSPDGRLLASSDSSGKIRLREVFSGLEIAGFDGHRGWTPAVCFSPDGRTLVTGGYDGTIRLWSVHGGAPHVGTLRAWVRSVGCSADGTWIAAGLADGSAAILRLPPSTPEADVQKPADLATLWSELAERDPRRAVEAVRRWSAYARRGAPEGRAECIAFLRAHLSPVPKDQLEELVRQLDHEEYEVRVRASGELERYGRTAEPALRRALEGNPSAEVRERVGSILKKMTGSAIGAPDVLRVLRSIEILESIESQEARGILESLAGGADKARETQEARATLERLRLKVAR